MTTAVSGNYPVTSGDSTMSQSRDDSYTRERLEEAYAVFKESDLYRNRRKLEASHLEQHLAAQNHKYELRTNRAQNLSDGPNQSNIWREQDGEVDDSDVEYQPTRRSKASSLKRKRHAEDIGGGSQIKVKKHTKQEGLEKGLLIMKLKTSKALSFLKKLADEDASYDAAMAMAREDSDNATIASSSTQTITPSDPQGRNLRSQKPKKYGQEGVEELFANIQLGDPAARGCKGCALLGERCSLLDDSYVYPCLNCRAQNECCERFMAPVEEDHQDEQENDINTDPAYRAFVKCDSCRAQGKKCSLRSFRDVPPCTQCTKADKICTVVSLTNNIREQRKKKIIQSAPAKAIGSTKIVETPWAHPVAFMQPVGGKPPCNFCADHRYCYMGYGTIKVEVMQIPGKSSYEEMGRGHRAKNHQATTMCVNCTCSRLYINACTHGVLAHAEHRHRDFPGGLSKELIHSFFEQGLNHRRTLITSCSICVAPAKFTCAALQRLDKFGKILVKGCDPVAGCGLMLCTGCATNFSKTKSMADTVSTAMEADRPVRADVEFLLPGSLLHLSLNEEP